MTEGPASRPIRPVLTLASRSPRRQRMLAEHGLVHEAAPSGLDDADLKPAAVAPDHWAVGLAYLKARAAWNQLPHEHRAGRVVLGADTVVVKGGAIIGQPRDADEAGRIIRALVRGRHTVVTGVALLWAAGGADSIDAPPRRLLFVDAAGVEVGAIGDEAIDAYIVSGGWRGKAGAYNLAERQDAGWPLRCEGDPTTVMGLPMRRLVPLLRALGVAADGRPSTAV